MTSDDSNKGIVVRIGCETDFVAKNDEFVSFVKSVANLALENFPADANALLALDLNGKSLQEALVEKTGVIGENIETGEEFEEEEQAFAEIVEYIRVAVLMLREDLRGPQAGDSIH